jgi:hypothetical protein
MPRGARSGDAFGAPARPREFQRSLLAGDGGVDVT